MRGSGRRDHCAFATTACSPIARGATCCCGVEGSWASLRLSGTARVRRPTPATARRRRPRALSGVRRGPHADHRPRRTRHSTAGYLMTAGRSRPQRLDVYGHRSGRRRCASRRSMTAILGTIPSPTHVRYRPRVTSPVSHPPTPHSHDASPHARTCLTIPIRFAPPSHAASSNRVYPHGTRAGARLTIVAVRIKPYSLTDTRTRHSFRVVL